MKWSTPKWLLNKYWNLTLDKLAPAKFVEIDGVKFRYLRRDAPPQDPKQFSAQGQEFHERIEKLSGSSAVDVGANIGSYALRLAKNFQTVTAFEPSPLHARVLRSNVKLNKLRNVYVEEVALSDEQGTNPLYVRTGGATSLDPSHYGLKYDKVVLVSTGKLDDFRSKLGRLDFVKIDAEGRECRILKGGTETISALKPILAIEVHQARILSDGTCRCETCIMLKSLGYEVEVTGEFSAVGAVHWTWATPHERRAT